MNTTKVNNNQTITDLLQPETHLETILLNHPAIQQGLLWGKPRKGHPEGKVLYHVREVLDNIDEIATNTKIREQLRLIAIIHDSFKYKEVIDFPRDWSLHHAVLARQFAEQFVKDQAVLDVIEWHDDAYYCWRALKRFRDLEKASHCFQKLTNRLGDNLELYYLFFKCDTQTGDKTQEPLYWFGEKVMDAMEKRGESNDDPL